MHFRPDARRIAACLVLACGLAAETAAHAGGIDGEGATFKQHVAPLLAKYCADCHGGAKAKAGLDVTRFADEAIQGKDRARWEAVLENVEGSLMPPDGKPRPSAEESDLITGWIKGQLARPDCGLVVPGRVTMRRLNRAEYNNTVRDLVGVDVHPADDFPSDDVGYGFDNIGDVLTLPPILFEKYLDAAEKVAEAAIQVGGPRQGPVKKLIEAQVSLYSAGEAAAHFDAPATGEYRIKVEAHGDQAGPEPCKMAIRVDGKDVAVVDVPAVDGDPGTYEARVKLKKGPHKVAGVFLNDYYDTNNADPKKRGDRNFYLDAMAAIGPATAANVVPDSHKRIIFRSPKKDDAKECAREDFARLATRAYRRPARGDEVDRLVQLWESSVREGDSFERGVQVGLMAVLTSPQFLFRVEVRKRPGSKGAPKAGEVEPLGPYEMASRLSYFLWSSMPDDELLELARLNKLQDDATLEAQARRMLKDHRARALVENFADQWLQIRNLKTVAPDPKQFPGFDEALRGAMLTETESFVESIMREDRSILDFLDADYTYLNERLAKHYGIAGVHGDKFRRVGLTGNRRGGVLTQASVLTVTSNPTRTSPVKRGKYVLEQILGTPPPPPPPGVGELSDEKNEILKGSLRQRMEQHRANPNCATCHSKMDPLGFGLESYDAVGAWREKDGEFAVDSSGVLPGGPSFATPKELKAILLGKRDAFAHCLAEKLTIYASGRGLDFKDRCVVDRTAEALAKDGYKFSRLVVEVVKSDPFRRRGGPGVEP